MMLPVDLAELCLALEAEAGDWRWYLDTQSGDVILVTHEYEPSDYGGVTAEEIESTPSRFRRVPVGDPQAGVDDMLAFAGQLGDDRLRESLQLALSAPRPDRRFRAVLGWLPSEQDRWHAFRQSRCEERAHEWLRSQGIAATPRPPDASAA